ncbi:MAG: glycerophosphodiester phosphodiesterase [Arthrobacter sp.]|jgi:glycerophosphoryl diester phosphodiesterase|nr:glycerophosphodiester phosphodiesterase [Arthrobacter sp.]
MPRIFAHRGSSASYAENTRAAFEQALLDGADGIETDVHLSADGVVVCHHDATLGRTSNGAGAVRELSLQQLRAFDYSSWKGVEIPAAFGTVGEQFCTLEELVQIALRAGRELELAIETKHQDGDDPRLEAAVLATLEALGFDPATRRLGQVSASFMSFEPNAVDRLLELMPREGVCQLIEESEEEWARDPLLPREHPELRPGSEEQRLFEGAAQRLLAGAAGIAGPGVDFIRANEHAARRWFERAVARIWTVDTLEDAVYLLGLGVTELTSNVPAALRAQLDGAGALA